MSGEIVTTDICERLHKEVCERLAEHDRRAEGIERNLSVIMDAQVAQAKTHVKLLESQEQTQKHLEQAAANLEVATQAIAANSEWQAFAQSSLTASQEYRNKENWRLIGLFVLIIGTLLGLKFAGITF